MPTIEVPVQLGSIARTTDCERWERCCSKFLEAVPAQHSGQVQRLIRSLHVGGAGLREWVSAIAWRGAVCPEAIPPEVIEAYLFDPEAVPLYDCEACGLAVPVRPNRRQGREAEPEQVYFSNCPACGGRTGWYLYWSSQAEANLASSAIRPQSAR